jgi:hypothetical protein
LKKQPDRATVARIRSSSAAHYAGSLSSLLGSALGNIDL